MEYTIDTEYITETIAKRGVTRKFVSEQTGIDYTNLSLKLNGKRGFSLSDIIALSRFLGCPVERLVKW